MAKQNILRPMLAYSASLEHIEAILKLTGELYVSRKLDGWRARVVNGRLLTRTGIPVPNNYTRNRFSFPALNGFDGELICGEPNAPNVYNVTHSAVSTEDGYPTVRFYVFDNFSEPNRPYKERVEMLWSKDSSIIPLQQGRLTTIEEIQSFEEEALAEGYEGLILRHPRAPYKFGRASKKSGWMMKLKRFADSEARIIACKELQRNNNEAVINAQGYTERSTAKSGLAPGGILGKLVVQDIKNPEWQFEIGSGFTAAARKSLWDSRDTLEGRIVTYKYLPVGMKDLPRHPIFKGFRAKEDM